MEEIITKAIRKALAGLGVKHATFIVERPDNTSFGDFSTNVALAAGKVIGESPAVFARKLIEKLRKQKIKNIEKIESAGPGFINFSLSQKFFTDALEKVLKEKDKFGRNKTLAGEKIMIEHTNLNPFKPFHIGHLVNHTIGESLSRLLENSGAEVKRVSYGGDVGLHVAKAVWGMLRSPYKNNEDSAAYLGRVYAAGSFAYEAGGDVAQEIKNINSLIYAKSDKEINELYDWGRAESLKYFEKIYKKLGVNFDYQFFESEVSPLGVFIVEEFLHKGVFEKSDGAVVFKGEKYGLHTRVFVNSQGLPTYEAKDLGLVKKKASTYPFDLSIVVTASEQSDYFKVILKVCEFVFPGIVNKMRHISHGFLRLASGKMSSRKGNVITGESLIADVERIILEKIQDRGFNKAVQSKIASQVAMAAIKFSILKQSPGKDIVFDFGKSLSFEGDSGPYLQYSYVRAKSILEKAEAEKIKGSTAKPPKETILLEKLLERFPEIVSRAREEFAPQYVTTHLTELAAAFNSFYAKNQIVGKKEVASPWRITLTHAFMITMKNGLYLLGIQTPDEM